MEKVSMASFGISDIGGGRRNEIYICKGNVWESKL